jgi:hypothetical protein
VDKARAYPTAVEELQMKAHLDAAALKANIFSSQITERTLGTLGYCEFPAGEEAQKCRS